MTANGTSGRASATAAARHASASAGELAPDGGEVGEAEQVAQRDAQELATLRIGGAAPHRSSGPASARANERGAAALRRRGPRRSSGSSTDVEQRADRRITDSVRLRDAAREGDERLRAALVARRARAAASGRGVGEAHDRGARRRRDRRTGRWHSARPGVSASAVVSTTGQSRGRVAVSCTGASGAGGCGAAEPRRRRPRRQRGAHPRGLRAGRGRRVRPRGLPRARDHRLPARGPAAAAGVRRSSPRMARQGRGPHRRRPPRSSASPKHDRDLYNSAAVLRARARCRASTASTSCRTTRCSTSSATSSRRPSTARCSSSAASASASRSARTRGARSARSSRRRPRGAELDRQHQRVAVLRGPDCASARRCSRRAPPTRRCPFVYVNLVGGQDELVFDGASMLFDEAGQLVARAQAVRRGPARRRRRRAAGVPRAPARSREVAGHAPALPEVLVSEPADRAGRRCPDRAAARAGARGLRGARARHPRLRARRTASPTCVIGLSGGIDSSLVAAIAVDALGAEHVVGVLMPSRFSSDGQRRPTPKRSPSNLGIRTLTVPIEPRPRRVPRDARPSRSRASSRVSPRRTSRPASAARSS